MKKNTQCVLACALICGLVTFSACSKDDDNDNPVTEPVLLSKIEMVTVMPTTGDTLAYSTQNNIWEGGLLKRQNTASTIKVAGINSQLEIGEIYTYNGKNCIESRTTDGKTVNNFTYDANGHLTSAVKKANDSGNSDGYTPNIQIKAYTKDGFIQQMEETITYSWGETRKNSYDLTWKDGDLVKYATHNLEPVVKDFTYEVEYDTYPSIYTGYPMAHYIFDGPDGMCIRGSRHTPIAKGYNYKYKNGRVVSNVHDNITTNFTYTDGTHE